MPKPTMPMSEFRARRKKFLQQLSHDDIAIITTVAELPRNHDQHHVYYPSKDFYYLTGFVEPEAIAVLVPGRTNGEFILFNRARDSAKEAWTGVRVGQEGAKEIYGADQAYPIEAAHELIPQLLHGKQQLYFNFGIERNLEHSLLDWMEKIRSKVRAGIEPPIKLVDVTHVIREMRLFKSPKEIAIMRHAAEISSDAINRAMKICRPGMFEYQIEAELRHEYLNRGAHRIAYEPVVAGGSNSCILHYIDNSDELKDKTLLLIDAGCEYDQYAADITRTFPVNGKYTPEQRTIYDLVLKAQMAAVKQVKPGNPWNKVQEVIVKILVEGLVELGILKGEVDELISTQAYRQFYFHNSGHWLGLDTHDPSYYKKDGQWRKFEPGMVTTVEPGLYIAADQAGVDKKWWNIGIRIEDDVLVTEQGQEILSAQVPKQPDEIEAMMAD